MPDDRQPAPGLLSTCIADLMRPGVAAATRRLIAAACGAEPRIPAAQTCCGQPALNAGRRADAKRLLLRMARLFADCATVVAPSGSCVGAIKKHMAGLFAPDEEGAAEAREFAAKCMELSEYLVERGFEPRPAAKPLTIAYHDSCAGLRELGIHDGPRALLAAAGHTLVPLEDADVCCGFGGSFAVKFGEVSAHMAEDKCRCALAAGADVLALGDLGCLLNIEGRMLRRGEALPVHHYAELIAD
ncbi:MAG: (Fe-S)-binding protein [Betaproteobacteria bacterium AqS2]|uniref:(Fe-S)-binding protein n=1 Tax=Candidatus Amphirhobacter heronislandensis TaxID=1732024 RepID=A0A930UGL0_9GAMM|nr:(Fe-S)-binding protein [Betaproteobacteria bacterium AqS2]